MSTVMVQVEILRNKVRALNKILYGGKYRVTEEQYDAAYGAVIEYTEQQLNCLSNMHSVLLIEYQQQFVQKQELCLKLVEELNQLHAKPFELQQQLADGGEDLTIPPTKVWFVNSVQMLHPFAYYEELMEILITESLLIEDLKISMEKYGIVNF